VPDHRRPGFSTLRWNAVFQPLTLESDDELVSKRARSDIFSSGLEPQDGARVGWLQLAAW
jgi:hypothetical protein